ncbi:MAG: hypothetical protein J7M14_01880, partial [Planctomycetes bacterium]|nr:hypothetical protein [Planctomycetota bacterium]
DLRWVSISTVGHPWVEANAAGTGATYNESSFGKADWGWPGARVVNVILGSGNTLRDNGEFLGANRKNWLKLRLDPKLIEAMVAGASHGLCLMEGTSNLRANPRFASASTRNAPYLRITVEGEDDTPPAPVTDLRLASAPDYATAVGGALMVTLKPPADAAALAIKVSGRSVDRWQVPFPAGAGKTMTFPLLDQPPDTVVTVEVVAIDAAGNVSAPTSASAVTSSRMTVPKLPEIDFNPVGGPPKPLGEATVWAFPEVTKVHPVSAKVLKENAPADFKDRNAVWDGATGTIRLAAAKAEIISFQLAIEGKITGCKIEVSSLSGPGGATIPNKGVKLWRNWYNKGYAEYALPFEGVLNCPSADNNIVGQTLQAVTVDYHVPKDTVAGDYTGTVTLSTADGRLALPLAVKVYDVTIPDEIHFNPELNCYVGPGTAGKARFKDSFKLAHYHRATINRVPYSQGGEVHFDWIPWTDGNGRVVDWGPFDKRLGYLLDGTLFKDNPRSGVPVPTFYLPFFEGWPLPYKRYYHPGIPLPENFVSKEQKLQFDLRSKPIDEAMSDEYRQRFASCVKQFVEHAAEKKWNSTIFEFYLNNKPSFASSTIWTLDEPRQYLDWTALNFWAKIYKGAIDDEAIYTRQWHEDLFDKGLVGMDRKRPTFVFRGDISRPQWQGDLSNGLMNIIYANSGQFSMPRLMRNLKRTCPAILYCYGRANHHTRSNWESAAWCLKAYAHHCDGVLPWQSLGGPGSLRNPDPRRYGNALIITTRRFGLAVASLRVHALRRGAQDCELLRLLQIKKGWTREHIGMLVAQKVPLTGQFRQSFVDDAAAVTFRTLTARGFCEMKEGVLKLLTE